MNGKSERGGLHMGRVKLGVGKRGRVWKKSGGGGRGKEEQGGEGGERKEWLGGGKKFRVRVRRATVYR